MARILLVDDDPAVTNVMRLFLVADTSTRTPIMSGT